MKIYRTFDDKFYKEKSRILGNCINIEQDQNIYHNEFIINKNTAIIKTDNIEYINEAINKFRFYNAYITIFKTIDNSFYKQFDEIHTFKLPINIIQPSQFFINKDKSAILEQYIDIDEIYIPVTIINDEYVSLDGHHRLYLAYINDVKMINVYMDKVDSSINDFVYFAKEQNIKTIKDLKVIPNDLFNELWNGFCDQYFNNI